MAPASRNREKLPVARSLDDFDRASGRWLERLVLNHRKAVLAVCALLTVVLGTFAIAKLTLNAGFDKMLPQGHPYIRNYLELRKDLRDSATPCASWSRIATATSSTRATSRP